MRHVCVITGTRADYGLLAPLMSAIETADDLRLSVIATCMHLDPRYGMTVDLIEADGFTVDARVELPLDDDSDLGIARATGRGTTAIADALTSLRPDVVVILGDRFEAMAAATAAYLLRIPIAHIHGGEVTLGALDDGLRHAITKLSLLHFTSAEPYRQRVIQLGENPSRVFNVGALGLDNALNMPLLERPAMERELGRALGDINLLVTFNPTTLEEDSLGEFEQLLEALDRIGAFVIFTRSNADAGNLAINAALDRWVGLNTDRSVAFDALGSLRYLSLMRLANAVVGNSSSGIIEAPALGTPTVNIGTRQDGRLRAASVIDCPPVASSISAAIAKALTPEFARSSTEGQSLYGDGHTAGRIVAELRTADISTAALKKGFYDLTGCS